MTVQLYDLGTTAPMEQLLIAEIGKEKAGKSRLAATGRKPVLFFDFDGRASSIAGTKDAYAISFRDNTGAIQPDALARFSEYLTLLEKGKNELSCLGFSSIDPMSGTFARTIVIDSITSLASAAMRYIKFTGGKAMARTISFGGMSVQFPGGFDAWNAEMATVEDLLLRTFALGTDVIVIFHETPEESPESTMDKAIYTGKVGIFPVRHQRLIRYFNEVWRVERGALQGPSAQSAIPRVITAPDYNFSIGATALNIDAVEVPDIAAMLAKHIARQGGNFTPTTMPATPAVAPAPMALSKIPGVVVTK